MVHFSTLKEFTFQLFLTEAKEERKDLVRMMIQGVGVDVVAKRVVWVKARPYFDVLFQLLNTLRMDEQRRFWIAYPELDENNSDIEADTGQVSTGVKIMLQMFHNALTKTEDYEQMRLPHIKSKIALQELSDLGCGNHTEA